MSCGIGWSGTSSVPTLKTPRADVSPNPAAIARYHFARWIWVLGLAVLAQIVFPTGVTDLAPLLHIGVRADRQVLAPFDFVVTKSQDELQREADAVAATVRPIYEYRGAALDSVRAVSRTYFSTTDSVARQGRDILARVSLQAGVALTSAEGDYLSQPQKRHALERALDSLFQRTLAQGVAPTLSADSGLEVIVRRGATETPVPRAQVLTFESYLQSAQSVHPDPGSSIGD